MTDPLTWELDLGTGRPVKIDAVLLFYHKDDNEKFWVSTYYSSSVI